MEKKHLNLNKITMIKMEKMDVSKRMPGIILVIISAVLFVTMFSFTQNLMDIANTKCEELCGVNMEEDCPHAKNIPLQSYVGFSTTFILAAMGVFLIINPSKTQEKGISKKIREITKSLKEDEKKVYDSIQSSGGAVFQSELVEKLGFSKVKVSRILDKLEGRGLIEKRRRGMANMIILKQQ